MWLNNRGLDKLRVLLAWGSISGAYCISKALLSVLMLSGNPEPVARWIRVEGLKRTELKDSEKYKIDKLRWLPGTTMKIGDYWYELVIRNVGDGDAGMYMCEAGNLYGSTSADVKLFSKYNCLSVCLCLSI